MQDVASFPKCNRFCEMHGFIFQGSSNCDSIKNLAVRLAFHNLLVMIFLYLMFMNENDEF